MSVAIVEERETVDRSSEFDQTAVHDHGGAKCFRCTVDGLGHEGDCDDLSSAQIISSAIDKVMDEGSLPLPPRFISSSEPEPEHLPFVSKTREAMKADVLRLNRDLHDTNKQLREARELVRQTQEDMSELCVLYARTGIELSNAEFRIKHLKTLAAGGVTITVKDLDGILNKTDADTVPEYKRAA